MKYERFWSSVAALLVCLVLLGGPAISGEVTVGTSSGNTKPVPPAGTAEFMLYGGDGGFLLLQWKLERSFVLSGRPGRLLQGGKEPRPEPENKESSGRQEKDDMHGPVDDTRGEDKANPASATDGKAEHGPGAALRSLSLLVDADYSEHYGIMVLSGLYRYTRELSFYLSLPMLAVARDGGGTRARAYGIGDLSAGLSYRVEASGIPVVLGGYISFPSGDQDRVESGLWVPTGNGSYGFMVFLASAYDLDWARVHGCVAYRGLGSTEVQQPGGTMVEQTSGGQVGAVLGMDSDRIIKGIRLGATLFTGYVMEGSTKLSVQEGGDTTVGSRDGLFVLDARVHAEYKFSPELTVRADVSAPLVTNWTGEVNSVHYRDYFFGLGLEYRM